MDLDCSVDYFILANPNEQKFIIDTVETTFKELLVDLYDLPEEDDTDMVSCFADKGKLFDIITDMPDFVDLPDGDKVFTLIENLIMKHHMALQPQHILNKYTSFVHRLRQI